MQAAGDFLSQKASQAQSVVADAAQSVKAAVRACNALSEWLHGARRTCNPLHRNPGQERSTTPDTCTPAPLALAGSAYATSADVFS